MKRLPILIVCFFLLGCSGGNNFSLRPAAESETGLASSDTISVEQNSNAGMYPTPDEQLDEALGLYQDALDSAEVGSDKSAQDLFERSIITITALQPDSLTIAQEDLEWLRWQLVEDYAEFLKQLPELPAESSPSTVYISLSEFLGDSIAAPGDLINLVLPTNAATDDTSQFIQLYPDVPLVTNKYVNRVLKFYQTKGRKVFSKWLSRGEKAIPYYTNLLKQEGMPEELVYLSMIESGFSTRAYSRAHASGPWQFISSTARIYDLEVGYWYDERRDPEKSTEAACRYLRKLYDEFGDWYLAFAAYNSGEGRVHRAMRKSGKKDYWGIRRHLPRQTRNYVPSYLAARIICQNPEKYDFAELELKPSVEDYKTVHIEGCISTKEIAKTAQTTVSEIKRLNPAIKRDCTPPSAKNFALKVPSGTPDGFEEQIAQAPRLERSEWIRHRIRRGEALSTIARKYGVSMRAIMEIPANNLRSAHRIRAGRYLMIPVGNGSVTHVREPKVGAPQPLQITSADGKVRTIYRVRKNDNLSVIADRFNVGIASIRNWNNLWGKRFIYPGQKLVIWTKSPQQPEETPEFTAVGPMPPKSLQTKPHVHIIQSGDTLWDISRLYDVSIGDLKKWNSIRSARRLRPGTQLKLEP
ncbi:hypothetical protein CEE37_06330 [candidate division LCP-89 bacterium B3_LCP]|uniref:LysM domain-containing protein n=1 Tax=candidate division LCP-89 bacterium B3_LCP TaxID=2012998 RepID=A0A532V235_UNCL8|nr:MAG: hypothetical protein CEE37_06330 [candidate division LCP-89 bacterium B3_LCP]